MNFNEIKIQFVNSIPLEVISGGNIYNAAIIDGLRAKNMSVDYNVKSMLNDYDITIIDSLYMHEFNPKNISNKSQIIGLVHQVPELSIQKRNDYKDCAKFIVTGEPAKIELMHQWQIEERNIEVLRPAISEFWRPKKVFRDKPKRVVMVANFTQNKGFEMLISVLKRLNHLEIEFHIIGNNELNKDYASYIIDAIQKTNNKVSFHFNLNRDEVYQQLLISDVFLSLSKNETFGMAIYEALCMNIPCLAYKSGDYNYFSQFSNYIMIDHYSENQFVYGLKELILNSELYRNSCNITTQHIRVWPDVIDEFEVYLQKNVIAC